MTESEPTEGKTDEELALGARAGSRRCFEELALRYRRRLYVYLRPRLGSDEDAEDMVQEAFLKIYRNIGSYDPAYRFSTWLYTAATRLAISSYRKKKIATVSLDGPSAGEPADPAAAPGGRDGAAGLWDEARTLAGSQFRALWLRYAEDMSIEEIAGALGRSRLAVRLLLHRARANLMKRAGPAGARSGAPAARAAASGAPLE